MSRPAAVPAAGGGRWRSRARIGLAAAASIFLHLALARGLALTNVRVSPLPPPETTAAKPRPRSPTADYTLQAPRSPAPRRPVHERPVTVAEVRPAASPRPAAREAPPLAAWQPREAALLAQLAAPTSAAPPPARPPLARQPAAPPTAPPRPAAVVTQGTATGGDAAQLPPLAGAAPLAPPEAGIAGGSPPPRSGSLLDRMAATAAEVRQRGLRPAAPNPAPARRGVADGVLDALRPQVDLPAVDARALAAAAEPVGDGAPSSPRPTRRGGLPEAGAVLAPFAAARRTAADEGLSVAVDVGAGLDASLEAARPRSPARVAAVTLPDTPPARDAATAFARRSRRDARGDTTGGAEAAGAQRRADRVIARGLAYLAASQQPDGRWTLAGGGGTPRLRSDSAATGLALLSFFGAGHDHYAGPHQATIRRGLEFLLTAQQSDGDLYESADRLSDSCAWLYSHAIATMALCEAVGMTGDPLIRQPAERACRFIAASQHPTLGGWRYRPGTDADLSVSGWMLVALRSGQLAGLDVDAATLARVPRLLEAAAGTPPGAYAYNPRAPNQRQSRSSGECMIAVGTLMRLHTGWPADDPRVIAAARQLEALPPTYGSTTDRRRDAYFWYYASQVLVHTGGSGWEAWYRGLVDTLEPTQERTGSRAGSWDPLGPLPDRWGSYGGRLYVTALHLLALEVPDRRLPTLTATE